MGPDRVSHFAPAQHFDQSVLTGYNGRTPRLRAQWWRLARQMV